MTEYEMQPILFTISNFNIFSYGLAMVSAFIICVLITLKHVPKKRLTNQDIYNLCLIIIASLLFGTKLMRAFVHSNFSPATLLEIMKFWERGSFSFYPAFLMAVILVFIYCRIRKIPLLKVMDYLLPIAILGVGIQRTFGCFMAGCCYGKPTSLPWGMVFPEISKAGAHFPGVPLHPTQLYYGITSFLIFIFLLLYRKRTVNAGETTALGFILLSVTYFLITFLRGDIPSEQIVYHLSRSQHMALGLFTAGLIIYVHTAVKAKKAKRKKQLSPPVDIPKKALLKQDYHLRTKGGTVKKSSPTLFILVIWILVSISACCTPPSASTPKQLPKDLPQDNIRLGSTENPVQCRDAAGQTKYLKNLKDKKGNPVIFKRIGHGCSTAGHILDKYLVRTGDGKQNAIVYMDMYCPKIIETRPIEGFQTVARHPPSTQNTTGKSHSMVKPKTISVTNNQTQFNIKSPKSHTTPPHKKNRKPERKNKVDPIPGFDDKPDPITSPPKVTSTTTTTPSAKVPQINLNQEKIPGFDDRPDTSQKTKQQKKNQYLSLIPIESNKNNQPGKKKNPQVQFTSLLNQSVTDVFTQLHDPPNFTLHINQKGHTIHNNAKKIKEFFTICTQKIDKTHKMKSLNRQILEPQNIDLIIAFPFRYNKKSQKYTITPYVASKADNKLSISKKFIINPQLKEVEIQKEFKTKLLRLLRKEFPLALLPHRNRNGQTSRSLYITFIPLTFPYTKVPIQAMSIPGLIDKVIAKGILSVNIPNITLLINQTGHTIHDNNADIALVKDILFNSSLPDNRKVMRIIDEIMKPNDIDYIFITRHREINQGALISIVSNIVSKPKHQLLSTKFLFQKDELVCKGPNTSPPLIRKTAEDSLIANIRSLIMKSLN